MTSLFNLFQSISSFLLVKIKNEPKLEEYLFSRLEDYDMTTHSSFLDIGSGFGKPVFHSAFQVGCTSKGVEVVPARVEFCIDFFYEFLHEKNIFKDIEKKLQFDKKVNEKSVLTKKTNEKSVITKRTRGRIKKSSNNIKDSTINFGNLVTSSNSFTKIFERLTKKFKLNKLDGSYYTDYLNKKEKSKNEFSFKNEIAFDPTFDLLITKLINSNYNKSLLIRKTDYVSIYDFKTGSYYMKEATSKRNLLNHHFYFPDQSFEEDNAKDLLKFGNLFVLDEINYFYNQTDESLYTNISNSMLNIIYNESYDKNIFDENIMSCSSLSGTFKITDLIDKIENVQILDFLLLFFTIYMNKKSYLDPEFITRYYRKEKLENLNDFEKIHRNEQDFYESLKNDLKEKERQYQDQSDDIELRDEVQALKESLCYLNFNPFNESWYNLTSFEQKDATLDKFYCVSSHDKTHFTHIYSYNKLMNKECRSKIAKILNRTNFKVLAWYSNPIQTKNAGLKNFYFLCKFPMQSTSTEKFHVYVYLKTKH
jgi:hypothetical protein